MICSNFFLNLCFLLFTTFCFAQQEIYLLNPSFEKDPESRIPSSWQNCEYENNNHVHIQPGVFKVSKAPVEGKNYVGMLFKDDHSIASIGQLLEDTLKAGQCYKMSLYLARSELYLHESPNSDLAKNHTTPGKLKIWGAVATCDKEELLAETSLIINTRWLKYDFMFEPATDLTYLVLEAHYREPTLFPYNGNVLIDNASPITPIKCK